MIQQLMACVHTANTANTLNKPDSQHIDYIFDRELFCVGLYVVVFVFIVGAFHQYY